MAISETGLFIDSTVADNKPAAPGRRYHIVETSEAHGAERWQILDPYAQPFGEPGDVQPLSGVCDLMNSAANYCEEGVAGELAAFATAIEVSCRQLAAQLHEDPSVETIQRACMQAQVWMYAIELLESRIAKAARSLQAPLDGADHASGALRRAYRSLLSTEIRCSFLREPQQTLELRVLSSLATQLVRFRWSVICYDLQAEGAMSKAALDQAVSVNLCVSSVPRFTYGARV